MTNREFFDEFDILYNSITSNQAPGLDAYEKSVFLTKAQDDIVKGYFNALSNKVMQGFDGSEIRQMDFSSITKSAAIETFGGPIFDTRLNTESIALPSDAMMIINERAEVRREGTEGNVMLSVVPLNYAEYNRLSSKPHKRPMHYQAWRLIDSQNSNEADIIVGPMDTLVKYHIRYVKRPQAIILEELDGVTIDGQQAEQECELDPIIHQEILQRAVELAKAAYQGTLEHAVSLGTSSQTNLGQLPRQ